MAKSAIVLDESQPRNFLPIVQDPQHISNMITRNLGGEPLSMADLDKAINPSGGKLKWEIPDIDGESESISSIEGVIIHSHDNRAYYEKEYDGSGERPDCSSPDGIHGYGVMADACGGICADCPMDKFGSGKNGSKACSDEKWVYILREGEMLPVVVSLTPTNKRALRTYGARLMNKKNRDLTQVVSKLTNSKATSKSGFPTAKVTITLVEILPEDEAKKMSDYAELMAPHIEAANTPWQYDEVEDAPVPDVKKQAKAPRKVAPPPAAVSSDEEDLEF